MAAHKYWFKARGKQRVGWVPGTWQGWGVLLLYIALLVHSFLQIDGQTQSVSDTLINFLPRFLIFTALLTIVTYLKGEPTTWHHENVVTTEDHKKE